MLGGGGGGGEGNSAPCMHALKEGCIQSVDWWTGLDWNGMEWTGLDQNRKKFPRLAIQN